MGETGALIFGVFVGGFAGFGMCLFTIFKVVPLVIWNHGKMGANFRATLRTQIDAAEDHIATCIGH